MNTSEIKKIYDYVEAVFKSDETGHDYYHMKRVAQMAKKIAAKENANQFICEAAGLLHDIGDYKLFSDSLNEMKKMNTFLNSIGLSTNDIKHVNIAIENVSFSKGAIPESLEGKIVQDADRLDAIGAIGIGRAFAYGGSKGKLMFDEAKSLDTTIQHFYDKLLKLKDMMHTDFSKQIAIERHVFMEKYLAQFLKEW